MNEFFATNRLSAYIDGELPEAEMVEVEKAIRENPSIRAEYSRMMNAVELLRSQGPMRAPEGFSQRLEARLAVEKAPKPRLGWLPASLRRVPMEALGLAMAALLVVFLIQRDPASDTVQDEDAELMVKEDETSSRQEEPPREEIEATASLTAESSEEEVSQLSKKRPERRKEAQPEEAPGKGGGRAYDTRPTEHPISPPISGTPSEQTLSEDGDVDWEDLYEEAAGTGNSAETNTGEINTGPTVAIGPVRYRLYPKSAEVLWQIEKLAERYGARLSTSSGRAASPFSMTTEKNYANLKVQMSPARLEAFVAALHDLGAMTLVQQDETRLYGGGIMELELEVQFEP